MLHKYVKRGLIISMVLLVLPCSGVSPCYKNIRLRFQEKSTLRLIRRILLPFPTQRQLPPVFPYFESTLKDPTTVRRG